MALEQFARYKVPKFQSSLEVFGRFEEIDPITDDPRCQVYLPDKINVRLSFMISELATNLYES